MKTIRTLNDLCAFLSADQPSQLNKRLYKATACGASISLMLPNGTWVHNSGSNQHFNEVKKITGFTIQTIVEGSDATVDSELFTLPVKTSVIDKWIKYMEAEAEALWKEANECDYPDCENPSECEGNVAHDFCFWCADDQKGSDHRCPNCGVTVCKAHASTKKATVGRCPNCAAFMEEMAR